MAKEQARKAEEEKAKRGGGVLGRLVETVIAAMAALVFGDSITGAFTSASIEKAFRVRDTPVGCGESGETEPEKRQVDLCPYEADDSDASPAYQPPPPLIPKEYGNIKEAIDNFITIFDARYRNGCISSKPPLKFYRGTLAEAVQQAFDPVGKERRPLALYLHHDGAIACNIFPTNILCSELVSVLLRNRFILWPWDVTEQEHQNQLRDWMVLAGMDISLIFEKDRFPKLLLIIKDEGQLRLYAEVDGTDPHDLVLNHLWATVYDYNQIQ